MPTWLKIILALVAAGILLLVAVGVGGYVWFAQNKGRLLEMGKHAQAEAEQFASTHDAAACVDEALVRLDKSGGLIREAEVKIFLEACLEHAAPVPAFCQDVPPRDEIMASATWAVAACTSRGRLNDQPCTRLLQAIQQHCGKRAPKAAP